MEKEKIQKEIAEINKAVGSGEVFNKFAKNDPRFDKYDFQDPQGWAEKEVLKREEMIRRLEGSKKKIDEKKQKITSAEENKIPNKKEKPKSVHDEVLSDEDLKLRKEEIYKEGDNYVEEHVGTGQFEYRKTPEAKNENIQNKEGKNPDDLGNVGLNVDKDAYDAWNDLNEEENKKNGKLSDSKKEKPKSVHDE